MAENSRLKKVPKNILKIKMSIVGKLVFWYLKKYCFNRDAYRYLYRTRGRNRKIYGRSSTGDLPIKYAGAISIYIKEKNKKED